MWNQHEPCFNLFSTMDESHMFYVSRYFYGMTGLIDNSILNCIKVLGCTKLVLTHSFENARKIESWIQI